MRPIQIVVPALSFLSLATASAIPSLTAEPRLVARQNSCMASDLAIQIASRWVSIFTTHNNDTISELIADNFAMVSDSVNYIAGVPLGNPTYRSKAAFQEGHASKPVERSSLVNVDAVSCNGVVVLRWLSVIGTQQLEVKGLTVLYTVNGGDEGAIGPGGWQVSQAFSEFNSAAWLVDLGQSCDAPSAKSSS